MGFSALSGLSVPAQTSVRASAGTITHRRSISPEAGRALEIISHAIDYLDFETMRRCDSFSDLNDQLDAMQLLVSLNRRIYFECPEIESLGEWFRSSVWAVEHFVHDSAHRVIDQFHKQKIVH